jgi:hypothetical protein
LPGRSQLSRVTPSSSPSSPGSSDSIPPGCAGAESGGRGRCSDAACGRRLGSRWPRCAGGCGMVVHGGAGRGGPLRSRGNFGGKPVKG